VLAPFSFQKIFSAPILRTNYYLNKGDEKMKKYTEKEFKEKAISMKSWISEINGSFKNTKQTMTVICKHGHKNEILAASLVRENRLDSCPKCLVEAEDEYNKNPKLCKYCNNPLLFEKTAKYTRKKIFCSHSCSAKANNKNRKRINTCLNCSKELSNHKLKYCSSKCQIDFQYKSWINEWLANKTDKIEGGLYKVSYHIRRYLFEKYSNKCSKCGWSEVNSTTGKIPLEIEHIDGNYKNNRSENITLLCPNCHSLTPTYKGANRGNGRPNRRKN